MILKYLDKNDNLYIWPLNYPWVIISDNIGMKISKDEYQTSCLLLISYYLNCKCMPSLIYYNKQAIYYVLLYLQFWWREVVDTYINILWIL